MSRSRPVRASCATRAHPASRMCRPPGSTRYSVRSCPSSMPIMRSAVPPGPPSKLVSHLLSPLPGGGRGQRLKFDVPCYGGYPRCIMRLSMAASIAFWGRHSHLVSDLRGGIRDFFRDEAMRFFKSSGRQQVAEENKCREPGKRGFSRPLSIGCGSKRRPVHAVKKEKPDGFSSDIGTSLGERSFGVRTPLISFFRASSPGNSLRHIPRPLRGQ